MLPLVFLITDLTFWMTFGIHMLHLPLLLLALQPKEYVITYILGIALLLENVVLTHNLPASATFLFILFWTTNHLTKTWVFLEKSMLSAIVLCLCLALQICFESIASPLTTTPAIVLTTFTVNIIALFIIKSVYSYS